MNNQLNIVEATQSIYRQFNRYKVVNVSNTVHTVPDLNAGYHFMKSLNYSQDLT